MYKINKYFIIKYIRQLTTLYTIAILLSVMGSVTQTKSYALDEGNNGKDSSLACFGIVIECSKEQTHNGDNDTSNAKGPSMSIMKINGFVKRSACNILLFCPEVGDSNVKVSNGGGTVYWQGALSNTYRDIPIPTGTKFVVDVLKPESEPLPYEFHWEEGYIYGQLCPSGGHNTCAGIMPAGGGTISVNLHWRCPNAFGC